MRIDIVPTIYIDQLEKEFLNSKFSRQGDDLFKLFPMVENGAYKWFTFGEYEEYIESRGVDCLFCRVANFLQSEGIDDDLLVCVFW